MTTLLHKEESYQIIGLCIEVHNNLGAGFLEIVYKDALEIEFKDEHVLSIMSIYQQLVKKSQNISDGFVDIPPIWYEPTKDILYDMYGNKPISAIIDRQNKSIKKIKDLHNE